MCVPMTSSYKNLSGCKRPLWPDKTIADDDSKTGDTESVPILKTAVLEVLISHCQNGRASGSRDGTGA